MDCGLPLARNASNMTKLHFRSGGKGFGIIELLVVIQVLGILAAIGVPSYMGSVNATRVETANKNARLLASAVQNRANKTNHYDVRLADYVSDLGGSIPVNPCTGTSTGYTITTTATTASVSASEGNNCGTWIPFTFSLTL